MTSIAAPPGIDFLELPLDIRNAIYNAVVPKDRQLYIMLERSHKPRGQNNIYFPRIELCKRVKPDEWDDENELQTWIQTTFALFRARKGIATEMKPRLKGLFQTNPFLQPYSMQDPKLESKWPDWTDWRGTYSRSMGEVPKALIDYAEIIIVGMLGYGIEGNDSPLRILDAVMEKTTNLKSLVFEDHLGDSCFYDNETRELLWNTWLLSMFERSMKLNDRLKHVYWEEVMDDVDDGEDHGFRVRLVPAGFVPFENVRTDNRTSHFQQVQC